jgi:signal peptidase I
MARRGGRRWLTLPVAALIVTVVLPLTGFFVVSWLSGWRLQIIESGSMEPAYPVGSLAVGVPVEPADVREGSVITFADGSGGDRLITHRVVAVIERDGGRFFKTRGDANLAADPLMVPARSLRSRVTWNVPYLGLAIDWLRWPRGFLILVVLPLTALIATEVPSALRSRRARVPVHATGAGHDDVLGSDPQAGLATSFLTERPGSAVPALLAALSVALIWWRKRAADG